VEGDGGVVLREWLREKGIMAESALAGMLTECEKVGALSLVSSLGLVHGDFAPWNLIRPATGPTTAWGKRMPV